MTGLKKMESRIYRVVSGYTFQGGSPGYTRGVPAPLAEAVKKNISGLDQIVTFRYYNNNKLEVAALHAGEAKCIQSAGTCHFC